MALPSQMQSSPVRGRYVYRRKRRRRGPAMLFFLILIAGLVTWLVIDEEEGSPESGTSQIATAGGQSTPAVRTTPSGPELSRPVLQPLVEDELVDVSARWIPEATASQVPDSVEEIRVLDDATMSGTAERPSTTGDFEEIVDTRMPREDIGSESGRGGPLGLAEGLIGEGRLVEARALLTQAVVSGAFDPVNAADARQLLGMINAELVFSPKVYPNDPWAMDYEVKPGDSLSRIVSSENLEIDWRLLQKINGMKRPEHIQIGQKIKLVKGPFHAVIDKGTHRMDLYLGEGPERTFVRSYEVGLGAMSSTPVGRFKVRKGSKLVNPTWTNPRTGQFFPADDPENPIGEFWMGLRGMDETNSGERGFGIHGTIEPDSIGTDSSMGCVRLRDGEIDMIYAVMAEGVSTVDVHR